MSNALRQELIKGAALWRYKQWLTCHTVVVGNLTFIFDIVDPSDLLGLEVARVLSIVAIEEAYSVCCLGVTPISKTGLHWLLSRAMRLL